MNELIYLNNGGQIGLADNGWITERRNNLVNYVSWATGQTVTYGNLQQWVLNGLTTIINGTGPYGDTIKLAEGTISVDKGYAGWRPWLPSIIIDPTKSYRFSVWVKRVVKSSKGWFYFGLYAYNSVVTLTGVTSLTTDVYNTNPYFVTCSYDNSETYIPEGNWRLCVSVLRPYTWTGTTNSDDSYIYDINGNKLTNLIDYKWHQLTGFAGHRVLSPYQSGVDGVNHTAYPRIDLMDGTEPSIGELLGRRPIEILPDGTFTPGSDTIGYWKCNNNLLDSGPLNNSGTTTGTQYVYVNGVYDYALYTTGSTSSVGLITSRDSWKPATTGLTCSLWVKNTASNITGITYRGWFGPAVNTTSASCIIGYSGGYASWYVGVSGGYGLKNILAYDLVPNWNNWNNIIGTYDGTKINIYVNGVISSQTTPLTGSTNTIADGNTQDYKIGTWNWVSNGWEGYIDEVILEKRAWSASEIKNYYDYASFHIRGY